MDYRYVAKGVPTTLYIRYPVSFLDGKVIYLLYLKHNIYHQTLSEKLKPLRCNKVMAQPYGDYRPSDCTVRWRRYVTTFAVSA